MINFRFHLVSLVAVFLALGLGILVGSTVIDQGIVNRLDSEIKNVRKENSSREATSKQLEKQNSQLQQYVDLVAPYAGDGRLDEQPVALIAERGVSAGAVKQAEQALQQAGAVVPAVLWLDDPWQLDTDARVQALESAIGVQGTASRVRDAALGLLARRLVRAPVAAPTSTTRPPTSAPGESTSGSTSPRRTATSLPATAPRLDALTALEQAGFVSVTDGNASAFAGFPVHAVDVLEVTGDSSDFAGGDFTAAFARAMVDAKLPTAVAAVYDSGGNRPGGPERGASLASILDDKVLSRDVSTVDDLDLVQGQIAAVLVVGSGNVGHYGYGAGASAPLPPHP